MEAETVSSVVHRLQMKANRLCGHSHLSTCQVSTAAVIFVRTLRAVQGPGGREPVQAYRTESETGQLPVAFQNNHIPSALGQ